MTFTVFGDEFTVRVERHVRVPLPASVRVTTGYITRFARLYTSHVSHHEQVVLLRHAAQSLLELGVRESVGIVARVPGDLLRIRHHFHERFHDWAACQEGGSEAVLREDDYVDALKTTTHLSRAMFVLLTLTTTIPLARQREG